MTNQHPITPPLELVEELQDLGNLDAIQLAYQAGADQELEACVEWLIEQTCFHPNSDLIKDLRAARRPKPPSLKEQALHALGAACDKGEIDYTTFETIKRALEALPND
jgi:transposase